MRRHELTDQARAVRAVEDRLRAVSALVGGRHESATLLCDDTSHEVVLVECGLRERDVILAVRKVTGLSLWDSRVLARRAPVILLGDLSACRAQSAVALLESDDARAEWRQEPAPGDHPAPTP
jgi:large subunit ribosomal protein L7/L12